MNNLNSVLIEGNMVRDPLTKVPIGEVEEVCSFTIANNQFFKNKDGELEKEVSFFAIEAWGKLGEKAMQEGKKGRGCRVVGRLRQDRWNDSEGRPHNCVVIKAEHIEYR